MSALRPDSAQALADELRSAAEAGRTLELGGTFSKRTLGGPVAPADAVVSTAALNRLLAYEPADLTLSVEAGMPWRELEQTLSANGQMLPLDPPFGDQATVGGVVAADSSGPRRRRFGTVRDLVIGMEFATLAGKLVQSGGMVVKNVAGLDMAKPMIGSLGTLAAVVRVNFKVFPKPEAAETFLFAAADAAALFGVRDRILRGQAQPVALDLLNRRALAALDLEPPDAFVLAAEAQGSPAVVARYRREYESLAADSSVELSRFEGGRSVAFWGAVRRLSEVEAGSGLCRLRISTTHTKMPGAVGLLGDDATILARAANGVVYAGLPTEAAEPLVPRLRSDGYVTLLEQGSDDAKKNIEAWSQPGLDFEMMRRLKAAFDAKNLLNPGRLYGKI